VPHSRFGRGGEENNPASAGVVSQFVQTLASPPAKISRPIVSKGTP